MKIFITFLMLMVLLLSLSLEVDTLAQEQQGEAFNRALVSFGLAKGLNAVISLLQGTQLSFTPIGVGLNFSIGEILDPFNDMVERFSVVMLLSSVSLGIEKIILSLSGTFFVQVLFALSTLLSIFFLWTKNLSLKSFIPFIFKIFLFALVLRFSAIVFIYTSAFIHTSTLDSEYKEAQLVVQEAKYKLDEIHEQNKNLALEQKEDGFFSGLSSKYDAVLEKLNMSKQLALAQESIDKASRNIITLITIFILETVILPLVYLWIFILSIKYIFNFKHDTYLLKLLYNKQN